MPKSEDVHVTLTEQHTYRTGASTTRTLPKDWSGYVDKAVADDIKKSGHGKPTPAKDRPWEADDSASKRKTGGKSGSGGQGNDAQPSSSGGDTVAGGGTDTLQGGGADTTQGGGTDTVAG